MAATSHFRPSFSGRRLHVCIVSIHYWPEVTGNAPYTTGLAEHLASQGHQVTVITGMPHYPEWEIHEGYRGKFRVQEKVQGVEIRRLLHYVPRRQSAIRRGFLELTHLLQGLIMPNLSCPDVFLGVTPSLSGGVLALLYSQWYRVPFGIIVQDLIGQGAKQSGVPGGSMVAGAIGALEGSILRRAGGVLIVSQAFRSPLEHHRINSDKVYHVRNWSHISRPKLLRDSVRQQLGWRPNECVVLHAGNMGYKQALENVVHAAQSALQLAPELRFILMGNGNQRRELETMGAGLDNLTFLDAQPEEVFPDILAAADILLVNERPGLLDMSLPSKLTSYFVAMRPIVAAVEATGATAEELRRSGAGVIVQPGDSMGLLAGLRKVRESDFLSDQLGSAGLRYVEESLSAGAAFEQYDRFLKGITLPDKEND